MMSYLPGQAAVLSSRLGRPTLGKKQLHATCDFGQLTIHPCLWASSRLGRPTLGKKQLHATCDFGRLTIHPCLWACRWSRTLLCFLWLITANKASKQRDAGLGHKKWPRRRRRTRRRRRRRRGRRRSHRTLRSIRCITSDFGIAEELSSASGRFPIPNITRAWCLHCGILGVKTARQAQEFRSKALDRNRIPSRSQYPTRPP